MCDAGSTDRFQWLATALHAKWTLDPCQARASLLYLWTSRRPTNMAEHITAAYHTESSVWMHSALNEDSHIFLYFSKFRLLWWLYTSADNVHHIGHCRVFSAHFWRNIYGYQCNECRYYCTNMAPNVKLACEISLLSRRSCWQCIGLCLHLQVATCSVACVMVYALLQL